jgi:hypothetical protein
LVKRLFHIFTLLYKAKKIPGPPSSSFFGHYKLLSKQNFNGNLSSFPFLLLFFWLLILTYSC